MDLKKKLIGSFFKKNFIFFWIFDPKLTQTLTLTLTQTLIQPITLTLIGPLKKSIWVARTPDVGVRTPASVYETASLFGRRRPDAGVRL